MEKIKPVDLRSIPHPRSGYFPDISNGAAWLVLGTVVVFLLAIAWLIVRQG